MKAEENEARTEAIEAAPGADEAERMVSPPPALETNPIRVPTAKVRLTSFPVGLAWKWATAVGLMVLGVWAVSRVLLGGGTTDSSAVSEETVRERAEPPAPFVSPPPDPAQAYSLTLAAFQDVTLAEIQAGEFAARRADLLFTIVPVRVSGTVFHRILAGPATDSTAAEELRASLGRTLSDEDSSLWIVRATPLAFALGDYESREAADRRAAELSVAWLAPYVFEIGPSDRPSFRVYAGAYSDSTEASVVRTRFTELGEEPPHLARRLGRYVSRP